MFKTQNHFQPTLARRPSAQNAQATSYSLIVTNNSPAIGGWDFFVYQEQPGPPTPGVFSLAWFAKSGAPSTQIAFNWDISYDFVWSQTGTLTPGVTFQASQTWPADPITANEVTLSYSTENGFSFNNQDADGSQGSLSIVQDGSIPSNETAVGIGMSGNGTFVVQGEPNITAIFTPEPVYYVAFGRQIQAGVVLETEVGNSAQVAFPEDVYTMYATLDESNLWVISATPPDDLVGVRAQHGTLRPNASPHSWPKNSGFTHISVDWADSKNPGTGKVSLKQDDAGTSYAVPHNQAISPTLKGSLSNHTTKTIKYTLT